MGYYNTDGAWIHEESDLADAGTGFSEILNRGTLSVPRIVQTRMAEELADDDTIRAGALAAVEDAIAGKDIVLASDPNVYAEVDDDKWAVVFEAPTPEGPRVAFGVDANGNSRGRIMSSIAAPFGDVASIEIWNSTHEWWTNNVVNRVKTPTGPEDRGCGVSSTGEIVVWDAAKRGARKARVVGDAGLTGPGGDVDDHDAPSRWTAPDGSWGFVVWNQHGDTDYHSFKITTDGTVDGFNGPQLDIVVSTGAQVSYQQLYFHSRSGNNWKFWSLTRTGPGWLITELIINPVTGTITQSLTLRRIAIIGNQQSYLQGVQVGRTIRIVAYVNPKEDTHAVWLLSLDMDSSTLTSPMDSSVNRDVSATGYTDLATVTPLLAETATSKSRRLFEASPVANAALFAEWDRSAPNDGHYYVATRTGSTTNVVRVPGGPTGPRIGYTPDSNYIGGASFSPSGKVASIHHDADFGGSVLRVWDGTTSRIVAYSHRRMARPVWIDDTEILVGDIVRYTDYFDYEINQRSVRA